jgi:hypothetical protein
MDFELLRWVVIAALLVAGFLILLMIYWGWRATLSWLILSGLATAIFWYWLDNVDKTGSKGLYGLYVLLWPPMWLVIGLIINWFRRTWIPEQRS